MAFKRRSGTLDVLPTPESSYSGGLFRQVAGRVCVGEGYGSVFASREAG